MRVINLNTRDRGLDKKPQVATHADWRKETEGDLRDAESRLSSVEDSMTGDPTSDQIDSIWRAYLDVEKSVAFIRAELDSESPGHFVNKKVYAVPDERQAVLFALGNLRSGTRSFLSGDLETSLKQLRESRNYLRVLMISSRRSRIRRARSKPG